MLPNYLARRTPMLAATGRATSRIANPRRLQALENSWRPGRALKRSAGRFLLVLGLVLSGGIPALTASAVPAAAASGNLVGNPGFETPITTTAESFVAQSVGDWTRVHPGSTQVESPVHSGWYSASTQASAGGGGAVFAQDLLNFPFNQSYSLSFWVYPQQGTQSFEFSQGWDRGIGTVTGNTSLTLGPTGTTLSDYQGASASAPALSYGQWHQVQIVQNVCTTSPTHQLVVDDVVVSTIATTPGTPQLGTIVFGQTYGTSPETDQFYWDDVSLQSMACPNLTETISFPPLMPHAFGDPPFTVSATTSSGLAVSFSARGACTVSGTSVTITAGGSNCAITATQAGNTAYQPAAPVTQTFFVACLPPQLPLSFPSANGTSQTATINFMNQQAATAGGCAGSFNDMAGSPQRALASGSFTASTSGSVVTATLTGTLARTLGSVPVTGTLRLDYSTGTGVLSQTFNTGRVTFVINDNLVRSGSTWVMSPPSVCVLPYCFNPGGK